MELQGRSIIGSRRSGDSATLFHGIHASTGEPLDPGYHEAGDHELEDAARLASEAFPIYRSLPRSARAEFLRQIASGLEAVANQLVERVMLETALLEPRVRGELARTCFQLRFFAGIAEEGSWVDARIDIKPNIRSMLRPLGPVAVFCASNFPLAFSVAGGDTASALAAGNPVVVNAHFSHPSTAELCGLAIRDAAAATAMPEGVFSLLFGTGHRLGQNLVAHPAIKAAGFTGSRKGGLALLAIARSRPEPVPFFAEMSSVNPVFILPHALEKRGAEIAAGLHGSITMGVGQFCTNPGVVLLPSGTPGDALSAQLSQSLFATKPAAMLNSGILQNYLLKTAALGSNKRVRSLVAAGAGPALFETSALDFLRAPELGEEVFGPSSLLVRYRDIDQAVEVAQSLEGNLTATIHSDAGDEEAARRLLDALETRVGRIVFQGYPTGVEVCHAMVHGGPYPATSDGRSTSVGARAIERFARSVCYQAADPAFLPEELRDGNPAGISRIVDGQRVT